MKFDEYIKLKRIVFSLSEDDAESGKYDDIIEKFNEYQRTIWGKIEIPRLRFSTKEEAEEWLKNHLPLTVTKITNDIKTTVSIDNAEVIFVDTSEESVPEMGTGGTHIIEGEKYYSIRWGKPKKKVEKFEEAD